MYTYAIPFHHTPELFENFVENFSLKKCFFLSSKKFKQNFQKKFMKENPELSLKISAVEPTEAKKSQTKKIGQFVEKKKFQKKSVFFFKKTLFSTLFEYLRIFEKKSFFFEIFFRQIMTAFRDLRPISSACGIHKNDPQCGLVILETIIGFWSTTVSFTEGSGSTGDKRNFCSSRFLRNSSKLSIFATSEVRSEQSLKCRDKMPF